MATLKNIIGMAQIASSSISSTSTGVGFDSYSRGTKYLANELNDNDYILTKGYLLLSFALSRTDIEKWGSYFNNPVLSLVIQGKDYNNADIAQAVYTNKTTSSNFISEWNGNYAIMRTTAARSYFKNFNIILLSLYVR